MRGTALLSILLLTAAPAFAESHSSGDSGSGDMASSATATAADGAASESGGGTMMASSGSMMIAAEAIEDATVYSLGEAYDANLWDANEPFGPITADWSDIGEVETLVLNESGQALGVTVDIGGFLGIGDNEVLIPLDDLRLVQNPDDNEFYVVTRLTRTALEEKEEVTGIIGDD